jgi:TRAP-type uncharacterized transport system substrate-binding protein
LQQILNKIQSNAKIRRTLAILLVTVLLGATVYFVYGLLPKKYTLSISGGGILTNRHHLARVLQSEAAKNGLTLEIMPVSGSMNTLEAVSSGELDIALIQGGLEKTMPNVSHVAMLPPEIVHIIVKPDISSINDLKGKTVNMGSTGGGTRIVAKKVLDFFGLKESTDYIEKNYSDEELFNMRPDELPDAIISISYIPSYIADYFIKEQGYRLLGIPNADSLGLRHVWVENSQILQCTYNADPPIPEEDIPTVGVELEIIANSNVNPQAVSKFMEVLYNSSIENVIKQTLTEESGDSLSQYPLSAGAVVYINRNEPFFSMDKLDSLKNLFGSLMAGLSTLMVVVKWFKGGRKKEDDTAEAEDREEEIPIEETPDVKVSEEEIETVNNKKDLFSARG